MAYTAKRPFSATATDVIGTVTFVNATYRGRLFTGTYDLVKGYQAGGNHVGFVTVREAAISTGTGKSKKTRITVGGEGFGYTVTLAADVAEVEDTVEESVEASRLLTYVEAADALGISKGAVAKRAGRGSLERVYVEGKPFIQM